MCAEDGLQCDFYQSPFSVSFGFFKCVVIHWHERYLLELGNKMIYYVLFYKNIQYIILNSNSNATILLIFFFFNLVKYTISWCGVKNLDIISRFLIYQSHGSDFKTSINRMFHQVSLGYTTLFEEDNIFNPFLNHSMKMTSVTVFTTSVTQSWKILQHNVDF